MEDLRHRSLVQVPVLPDIAQPVVHRQPSCLLPVYFMICEKRILIFMRKSHNMERQRRGYSLEEQEAVWRIWVDTRRKVVSFHEEEGSQLMEFRSWEMFIHCVDEYAKKRYRYQ